MNRQFETLGCWGVHIDLLAGGDGHLLGDALEGHTVDLTGAGHEQKTRAQHLEEDDTLATESASEEDKDLRTYNIFHICIQSGDKRYRKNDQGRQTGGEPSNRK